MTGRLYRSRSDRMLFGVSGGLAEYMDVDPTLVRLGWIALAFVTAGVAVIAYVVLAIVAPEGAADAGSGDDAEGEDARPGGSESGGPRRGRGFVVFVGAMLIAMGVLFLGINLDLISWIDWGVAWPVVLILLGLLIIAQRYRSG